MIPLVSIIIPVYNGSEYMREAIDSALSQTYPNIEVLVINDGSNDNGETERIALSYENKIRYFRKENGGVSSALNLGISKMKGEYFSWLSHDDVYCPEKVQREVESLQKFNDTRGIALCNCIQINSKSEVIQKNSVKQITKEEKLSWEESVRFITKESANGCALLIPKSAFEECGGFDERLRYCQDVFMWWKLFLNGFSLVFCDYCGVLSRVHDKQLTQTGIALYHHDALLIAEHIVPMFVEASTRKFNFLYDYAIGEAKHNNPQIVKLCMLYSKPKKLITPVQAVNLRIIGAYGKIRPLIRKIYYRVVKRVKTN